MKIVEVGLMMGYCLLLLILPTLFRPDFFIHRCCSFSMNIGIGVLWVISQVPDSPPVPLPGANYNKFNGYCTFRHSDKNGK